MVRSEGCADESPCRSGVLVAASEPCLMSLAAVKVPRLAAAQLTSVSPLSTDPSTARTDVSLMHPSWDPNIADPMAWRPASELKLRGDVSPSTCAGSPQAAPPADSSSSEDGDGTPLSSSSSVQRPPMSPRRVSHSPSSDPLIRRLLAERNSALRKTDSGSISSLADAINSGRPQQPSYPPNSNQ
eukprot:Gregarina_sp_Pseudo_9__5367@NODE_648_length_2426_cov_14_896104_g611_i0_p2_GENE_NODE_648_length_2426_cov_14_896104_g611_i0NODE_648_length_2426_cov_14_896104_g611_i0_p2_ORF_typecomplete_len185_score41_35_NODE_648_length_2426_cov_14_896104_g611_i015752129